MTTKKEKRPNLSNVCLICVDCYNYGPAVSAIQKSILQADWGAVKFLTDINIEIDGVEVIQIQSIKSKEQYSEFCIKELSKYFTHDFVMVIQHDGYVINGDAWDNVFFDYDYIGAPWLYVDGKNVGCGGASLRSKKLQDILMNDESINASDPEDQAIGRLYRDYLIKNYGIKFPTEEIADKFAFELRQPKCQTFAFHGNFHEPYKPTVIVKRDAALGDCIIMEPLLRYYAAKNWNVVVDIPLEYYDCYNSHYFPITHISKFDRGRIKEEKFINLNLAYEVKPRQNYLKSYFEFAGIKDYQLTRPQLYPYVNEKTKLFKKYAVINIDRRDTKHRNTIGVNWQVVRKNLEAAGYVVIQVGNGEHDIAGIELNCPSIGFLKFVISGCDLFIGVDSGPAQIAAAYNKPCVLLFGSVNPEYIYPNLDNIEIIQGPCEKAFCWHYEGGTAGKKCEFIGTNKEHQCCIHETMDVLEAANRLINKQKTEI